jgi:hypothetical protein
MLTIMSSYPKKYYEQAASERCVSEPQSSLDVRAAHSPGTSSIPRRASTQDVGANHRLIALWSRGAHSAARVLSVAD